MTYSTAFLIAMLHLFQVEGGYAVLRDGAGPTKYGITHRSYPRENIKQLTKRKAGRIYHKDFWSPIRAEEMSCMMANTVFDFAVNAGKPRAIRTLQHIVKLPESGVVNQDLLKRLVMLETKWAHAEYNKHRLECYASFKGYRRFGRVWRSRIPNGRECENKSITEAQVFG
jgi:lysozyme family protein